jgi:hypothetical protein
MKKLLIAVPFLLLGCYPDGPDYAEDLDVVYTTYDKGYDFSAKNTFAMPDKIVVDVKIDHGDTTYEYMKPAFADPILDAIQSNMESYGWSRVDIEDNPGVILTPAGLTSTTYFYSYWYDWWYGGYWGWYYPPYYTVSSYTTGSLVMTIADPSAADDSPINRSPAVWIGVGNGLVSGAYDISRVTESIDQAFLQSPYLDQN